MFDIFLATFGNFCHAVVLSSCHPVILSYTYLSVLSFCPFVIFTACQVANFWASQLVSFSLTHFRACELVWHIRGMISFGGFLAECLPCSGGRTSPLIGEGTDILGFKFQISKLLRWQAWNFFQIFCPSGSKLSTLRWNTIQHTPARLLTIAFPRSAAGGHWSMCKIPNWSCLIKAGGNMNSITWKSLQLCWPRIKLWICQLPCKIFLLSN